MSIEEYHTNGTLEEEERTERKMIIDPQVFWRREYVGGGKNGFTPYNGERREESDELTMEEKQS